jgi:uncharacterized protein with NAD-binding domain and iron-sulfur cluster
MTRRRFLFGASAAAAGVVAGSCPGWLRPAQASGHRRPTVAVFGGGVAGLTAAHELAERGFDVTIYERRAWGGKARSMDAPDAGPVTGGRRALPGEHGMRVVFGFEQNLPHTMMRIPFGSNRRGVFDNLDGYSSALLSRAGARDLVLPLAKDADPGTPAQIVELVTALALDTHVPPAAATHFARRLAVYFSSCDERRFGQWENVAWADFIGADRYTHDYRTILSETWTHLLQSSNADSTSVKFVGNVFEWVVYSLLRRNSNGPAIRSLNAPTNEAWIDPWLGLLARLGVRLALGYALEGFELDSSGIARANVRGPAGAHAVVADYYVCALPVERARQLWTPALVARDADLALMNNLRTDWMSGIQYYLRTEAPVVTDGIIFLDSPWKMAAVFQQTHWRRSISQTYGDGTVRDVLSVVISDWHSKGNLHNRFARDCTPQEVAEEAWFEMKQHLNDRRVQLTDDMLAGYHLDPGLLQRPGGGFDFEDPLVLPSTGAWPNRPPSGTAIANLILAGDYVRGHWEVANMEIANESGRRACNAILERAGSNETPADVFGLYHPPEWEPLKRIDRRRYRAGRDNLLEDGAPIARAVL